MTSTITPYRAKPASISIDRLLPRASPAVSDDEILQTYGSLPPHSHTRPWVRLNFVSSIDGSATRNGLSGALGTRADHRLFGLLRRSAEVILVGAGTIRAEAYDALLLSPADVAWRRAHGLGDQPRLAVVSGRLDLDPASAIFTDAPVRPIIYTARRSADASGIFDGLADVVAAGDQLVDPIELIDDLSARGLMAVHCEGGPTLAGQLLACDRVDEICLTISPQAVGGPGGRIIPTPCHLRRTSGWPHSTTRTRRSSRASFG